MAVATLDPAPADALPLDTILCGDALEMLRTLPDNLVDAIVTDPPAGISFMGKHWDSDKGGRDAWIAWLAEVMTEALRVVKPGGHALVWALPRTSHWTAMALEDAGWEIRDRCSHIFGSGFPKSLDVSKQLDKAAGAKRAKVGSYKGATNLGRGSSNSYIVGDVRTPQTTVNITAPATDAARTWDGWGTALKPAVEDWWLCRKPLSEKNVAANVLRWGTGALNIGASRVGISEQLPKYTPSKSGLGKHGVYGKSTREQGANSPTRYDPQGRWPANLVLSHAPDCTAGGCSLWCPVRELDAQSGIRTSSGGNGQALKHGFLGNLPRYTKDRPNGLGYGDTGGASRYFTTFAYVPKASRTERNRGCLALPTRSIKMPGKQTGFTPSTGEISDGYIGKRQNIHPTVKPLALMSWLIRLITPPGGIVLDPFAGSGSTLCAAKAGGWRYIGIEKEAEYVSICRARVQAS